MKTQWFKDLSAQALKESNELWTYFEMSLEDQFHYKLQKPDLHLSEYTKNKIKAYTKWMDLSPFDVFI